MDEDEKAMAWLAERKLTPGRLGPIKTAEAQAFDEALDVLVELRGVLALPDYSGHKDCLGYCPRGKDVGRCECGRGNYRAVRAASFTYRNPQITSEAA